MVHMPHYNSQSHCIMTIINSDKIPLHTSYQYACMCNYRLPSSFINIWRSLAIISKQLLYVVAV